LTKPVAVNNLTLGWRYREARDTLRTTRVCHYLYTVVNIAGKQKQDVCVYVI